MYNYTNYYSPRYFNIREAYICTETKKPLRKWSGFFNIQLRINLSSNERKNLKSYWCRFHLEIRNHETGIYTKQEQRYWPL